MFGVIQIGESHIQREYDEAMKQERSGDLGENMSRVRDCRLKREFVTEASSSQLVTASPSIIWECSETTIWGVWTKYVEE